MAGKHCSSIVSRKEWFGGWWFGMWFCCLAREFDLPRVPYILFFLQKIRLGLHRIFFKRKCNLGWGIDSSVSMVKLANERIEKHNLSKKIQIYLGDAREIDSLLSKDELNNTELIMGGSILNEFCRHGTKGVISFLKKLKCSLPKVQFFIVCDYYGKLGKPQNHISQWTYPLSFTGFSESIPPALQHNLLHDVAQALSGQGIPFPTKEKWKDLYHESGWNLIFEKNVTHEMDSFVHVIQRA